MRVAVVLFWVTINERRRSTMRAEYVSDGKERREKSEKHTMILKALYRLRERHPVTYAAVNEMFPVSLSE